MVSIERNMPNRIRTRWSDAYLESLVHLHDSFSQATERLEIGQLRGFRIGGEVSVKRIQDVPMIRLFTERLVFTAC